MYLIKTIKGDITNITDEGKTRNMLVIRKCTKKGTCINRLLK